MQLIFIMPGFSIICQADQAQGQVKAFHIIAEFNLFFSSDLRTVSRFFGTFGHLGGKDHAGGLAAVPAIGFGQKFQDFNDPGSWQTGIRGG